ncbi:c-type cytochrome [Tahibacter amnicola]|uniref:Cytochrome c n=1 Tax=Tahibacter amnicola TaxID=2976241 RepID=A0ABY6BAP3_9GAMM|nr:cytochrome c [Tahibacter amnicola]UXI67129.1 cytochrome c [Tahibacter amnicola]
MKTILSSIAITAACLVSSAAVAAGADLEAGKKKSDQQCLSCHGADGNSIAAQYPRLAGQYKDYLEHALRQYRSGARVNAIMNEQAKALTDQEIKDLSAYFASLPTKLTDLSRKNP